MVHPRQIVGNPPNRAYPSAVFSYEAGRLIRLFDQEDTAHHIDGTRLLEQIQQ